MSAFSKRTMAAGPLFSRSSCFPVRSASLRNSRHRHESEQVSAQSISAFHHPQQAQAQPQAHQGGALPKLQLPLLYPEQSPPPQHTCRPAGQESCLPPPCSGRCWLHVWQCWAQLRLLLLLAATPASLVHVHSLHGSQAGSPGQHAVAPPQRILARVCLGSFEPFVLLPGTVFSFFLSCRLILRSCSLRRSTSSLRWRATTPPTRAPIRATSCVMPTTSTPKGVPHSLPSCGAGVHRCDDVLEPEQPLLYLQHLLRVHACLGAIRFLFQHTHALTLSFPQLLQKRAAHAIGACTIQTVCFGKVAVTLGLR